ncbi:hypothetical protein Vi05172_g971 [Venturia inaequalis]|nr:hypothetical protein Vi05172_g971 [Venturia inaequalis]
MQENTISSPPSLSPDFSTPLLDSCILLVHSPNQAEVVQPREVHSFAHPISILASGAVLHHWQAKGTPTPLPDTPRSLSSRTTISSQWFKKLAAAPGLQP